MSKGLRSKHTKQCEISFNIAKQEALDYINRGEEKPGCIVKEVNSVIGKGLFANKEYTAGEFIMEYAGELINRKEGLKREKCYPLEKGSYIYFFLFDSKKFCLDATNSTKHGRYANDAAPGDTQENAVMKCVSNKGRPHLALFAMRKIAAGEEVRYDYGVPNLPWRKKADDVLQCKAEGQHHENTLLKKCSVLLKRVSEKVLNKIRKVESDVEEYMHVEVNESIEKTPVESDVEEYMHVEVNESIEKTPVESDVEEYMHVEVNESIEKTPDTGNTCHECKVSFNLESSLHRHTQTCHPDESCIDFLNCGKCKSIFGDIQSFMDHKRFCQANGRKDQREKKTDVVAIMGSFHQSSPEIFQHSAAGTQCSSMCLTAIVAFSLKNVESWDSNFVDNVLKGGDKLHLEILKSKQWPYHRKESRLAVDELPQKFECQIGRHDVIANSEYQEPLFGFSSYIETFVLTSIINHPNQSFILRMYDFCIAILCSNQNQYSIFDSHAKNSEGIIDANGTAGLFNFRNPAEMVKYLKCTTTEKNVQIDLYPVTVQFMRTEVMEESVPCVENLTAALNQATESSHKSIPCRETESPEKEQNNRKIPNEAEKTQKKMRPKRPCPFCDKLASRLSDHIKRKHKNEESVVNALSLPKELRDREFQTFKKEGIFKVNSNLLSKEASPDFENLLHERRFVKSNSTVVCSLCKGFYSKRRIARHKKTCFRAENCTDYPTSFNVTLLRNDEEYSDKYRKEILEGFHENEVGKLIRNDAWIKQYGYLSYQNFEGTEKRAEKRKSLMSKLRRLGHLYLQFKKIMSEKHPNFAFTSCREMFKRDNILGIQSAINSITTTDNENVIKSGLKVSLRYLIADVCKVMRAYFLFTRQDEEAEEMSKFISVLQVYWPSFFATAEESVLKKRQSDLRRPSKLPKEEEIDRLIIFTKEVIKNLSSGAGYQILENNNYCELRNTVVCRLTLCNARRGGEPSRMTLTEWNDAFNDVWVDPTKINDVTDEDKKLLCEYKIAYIHASKVSKLVSLLIPEDCWKAMKILADPEIRRHADINVKNKFVFPSVKNSLTHVTGWVCVNNVCRKAGLKHCVTATGMRHYMSTAYARKSVSAAERELFFKHLGHSRRMNEDVYQTPLAIQTITTVGKFMSSIEGDGGSKFSVSDFQPGDQALESSNCSVSDFQPGDQAFESVKRKNRIDDSLLEEEIPRPSKKMKRIPTCTKERTFHGDSEFHYSDTESSDSEKFSPMKVEKTEEKDTRHTWLEHEDRAIDDFFQTEINEFSNVGNKGSLEGVFKNATVDLTHIDTPSNMNTWPQFHNGVAAGLRMADFSQVDSTWILYNKPKGNELTNEYAGFLMALGLNEHLIQLHSLNVHDYLSKGSEMTTVGLLLGLAAAKRGTMDFATTRILSIHVAAFLPPTSTELNVPHNVQVAAILGVGLVYQGTAHRHTSEVLLSEIGRPPGPELDNCTDRESYSLAAGMALGLVMFGKGNEVIGTSDLGMADTLCHFMTGGHKRPLIGSNKERYKAPSYQIREGDNINVDVTSPGATLALGMLYFRTNNSAVIDWLRVPDTQFMLDQVRPDFLMLRSISRGLVMWDSVVPSFDWIKSMIPQILQEKAFERKQRKGEDVMIDYETMSQSYCNVVAGGCMVIGLKFAGTANQMAFGTLMKSIKLALTIMSSQSHVEQTGRGVLENCMVTILLSLAMVMAGSGNLEVLRLCRMLRARIGPPHNIFVTYGSHMAISMAVGLLFLGGGRHSLSTTPEAVGIMLCAFFPKFPFHSNDNRYHLQAFRHLYVLATEARVVLPRDVDSGEPCYVPIEIKFRDTGEYSGESFKSSAPTLLPQLHKIEEVRILGPRYWPITFQTEKNWKTLQLLLKKNGVLFVKQRAGYLSYVLDPKGYRSVLAKSLTSDHSSHTSVQPDVIKAFTSDPVIISMADYFLKGKEDCQGSRILQKLSSVLYSSVTCEKPEVISAHLRLDQLLNQSSFSLSQLGIRQLRNILSFYYSSFCFWKSDSRSISQLLQMEFLLALKSQLENKLDEWQSGNMEVIVKYLKMNTVTGSDLLSAYVTWYDIPTPEEISKIVVEGGPTLPVLCAALPHLPVKTVMQILTAWQAAV